MTTTTTTPDDKDKLRRLVRNAAIVGAILGLACSSLPAEYQAVCHTVASALGSC